MVPRVVVEGGGPGGSTKAGSWVMECHLSLEAPTTARLTLTHNTGSGTNTMGGAGPSSTLVVPMVRGVGVGLPGSGLAWEGLEILLEEGLTVPGAAHETWLQNGGRCF